MVNFSKQVRTGVGTNTNLVSPNAPVQSLDRTPNAVLGHKGHHMHMSADNTHGKSNTANTSSNQSPDSKRTGSQVGGKHMKRRNNTKKKDNVKKGYPVAPFNTGINDSYTKSNLTITQSDFSYEIIGSTTPNDYSDSYYDKLFRDYNTASKSVTDTVGGIVNTFCGATNQFKLFRIDPKESNAAPGYVSSMTVILDVIRRNVESGTRSAKGAMEIFAGVPKYLEVVPKAFALLIQLESLQAWNPPENTHFDNSLRILAAKISQGQILEWRTDLRQTLIPHVLPIGWMKYIKWIYSPHLRNESPYSTKQRFVEARIAHLIQRVLSDGDLSDFATEVQNTISEVKAVNQGVPSLMLNYVRDVDFANCKDWYNYPYISANYDPEWNNIFNNRGVYFKSTPTGTTISHYPTVKDDYYVCFDSVTPYNMALTQASRQSDDNNPGLPLESNQEVALLIGQNNWFNRFYISEFLPEVFKLQPVISFTEDTTDSIHRVEFANVTGAVTIDKSYSMPHGVQTLAMIAGDSNCRMAARESLSSMTLNNVN